MWAQEERELSPEVFDDDGDHAFERALDGPVDDDRTFIPWL